MTTDMTPDQNDMAEQVARYLENKSPRTKREIENAIGAKGEEVSRAIHRLRGEGRVKWIAEDDGVTRYALAAPAGDTPLDQEGTGEVSTPSPKKAPSSIPPADEAVTRVFTAVMTLVADGAPRSWREIAAAIGVDDIADAVKQRLWRRGLRMVSRRGGAGLYTLQPKTRASTAAPLPVAEVEEVPEIIIQPPAAPPPSKGCGGACGCGGQPKPPAQKSNRLLDALLADAQELADEALEEYVGLLDDPRLNALIQASRNLRDARAALS